MGDKNAFGGGNPNSLYVPMSETEQEFIHRLMEEEAFTVRVHGWGVVPNPTVSLGDLQVVIPLTLRFDRPEVAIPVSSFDLELLAHGMSMFREKQPTEYDGKPLYVGSGTVIQMVWHIGIKAIDPNVIKALRPGVHGLTSRQFDKDTGSLTLEGNMKLNGEKRKLLQMVRQGEAAIQADKDSKVR